MTSPTIPSEALTLSPVALIFSASWSTATLLGAHTSTCPWSCLARWYTMAADVTVLPVPGGQGPLQDSLHSRDLQGGGGLGRVRVEGGKERGTGTMAE